MMRTVHIFGAFILALGACAPLTVYHRAGASVAGMQRDANRCAVTTLSEVPVNTQIRQNPPRYIPGRKICNGAGRCRVSAGYYIPGRIYSVDGNKRLRNQTEALCMADKGYAPVSIPPCPDGVAQAVKPGVTTTFPVLRESSCVIRNNDGSWQIVSQG